MPTAAQRQRMAAAAAAAAATAAADASAASTARKGSDGKASTSKLTSGNKCSDGHATRKGKPTFQVDDSDEYEDTFSDEEEDDGSNNDTQQQRQQQLPRHHGSNAQEEKVKKDSRPTNVVFDAHDDFEDEDDDDDDEEAVAFEMDGQELWAQNYCATCDCLIEPGQGVGPKKGEEQQQQQQQQQSSSKTKSNSTSPTSALSRASSGTITSASGLKSKSGTIKARPPSSEGQTSEASSSSNLKRTSSAGRIHTVGGGNNGGAQLGPHKRTGSAASRLNALSELKPTTKLHADGAGETARVAKKTTDAKPKSSGMTRRSSSKSTTSSSSHAASVETSPVSPNSSLPRTKKGGLLGPLTPAALKQEQEAEAARLSAPPALYCSERCRMIDEQRSSGLGELIHYLSEPLKSPTWTSIGGGMANMPTSNSQWPARVPSQSSMSPNGRSVSYSLWTPESECTCPDCFERGSTVPSGASDTTESSGSNAYGPTDRKKQRSQSGRIVTPQNLVPPGGDKTGNDGYFGAVAYMGRKGKTRESPQLVLQAAHQQQMAAPTSRNLGRSQQQQHQQQARTMHDNSSNAGTDSSTRSFSSSSKSDLFDRHSAPSRRRGTSPKSSEGTSDTIDELGDSGDAIVPSSIVSDDRKSGTVTTGTVTPAAATAMSPNFRSMSVASTRANSISQSYGATSSSSSPHAAASLRLLRRGEGHAQPSIDVTADIAHSPSTSTFLSRSMASERTEMGASSITLGGAGSHLGPSSLLSRRQERTSTHLDPQPLPLHSATADDAYLSKSYHDTSAIETLKLAQARASMGSSPAMSGGDNGPKHHRGISETAAPTWWPRQSLTKAEEGGDGDDKSRRSSMTATVNGSWLRSSLTSAWATIRGLPTFATTGTSDDGSSAMPSPNAADVHRSLSPSNGGLAPPKRLTAEQQLHSAAMSRRVSKDGAEGNSGSGSGSGRTRRKQLEQREEDAASNSVSHDAGNLVCKPTTQRGSVPAFAHEIGHGRIPGEGDGAATEAAAADAITKASITSVYDKNEARYSRSATSPTTATFANANAVEEERRRRRAQHKHQRSKDVTALPPLLGASRPGSSTNLYAMRARPGRTHSTTSSIASFNGGGGGGNGAVGNVSHGVGVGVGGGGNGGQQASTRSRAGSNGSALYVGSAGSYTGLPAGGLSRPTTPGMRRSPSGARTPPANEIGAAGFSPGHSISFLTHAATSPRRAGLGWGGMTSISGNEAASAAANNRGLYAHHPSHHRPHHSAHIQGHQHRHHPHPQHQHPHQQQHHGPNMLARPNRSGANMQLGNVGLLGHHPHGHASIYGRHATTPVRSSTPRVPEEGGEMSGAALKGEVVDSPTAQDFADISRPKSAMGSRGLHLGPPPRPKSTMGVRSRGMSAMTVEQPSTGPSEATKRLSQHDRTRSYENASSGVKFYPVLEVSGQQTHDRYDAGWNLGENGLTEYLPREKFTAEPTTSSEQRRQGSDSDRQVNPADAPRPNRKKLFYFDAT